MHARRSLPTLVALVALAALSACGSDTPSATTSPTTATPTSAVATTTPAPTTTPPPTTVAPTTVAPTTVAPTTSVAATSTTTIPIAPAQPAMWPAAGVFFATPDEAAADFVEAVLGVPAVVGPFVGADARSGEIAVFSPGEGGTPVERSVLIVRQLAPSDGWFVIAAIHDTTTITSPESGSTVTAGPITVAGLGHGFEASIMVSAYVAGNATPLDAQHTMAGTMEAPGEYQVTLDLSGAAPGDVVMLLVNGGTGLETDPGEFGAIPVVIGS